MSNLWRIFRNTENFYGTRVQQHVFYVKLWYFFLPREVDFLPFFTSFAFVCNFFNSQGVNQVVLETATSSETKARSRWHLAS